jgi:ribosomal protein L11 methyltransferase
MNYYLFQLFCGSSLDQVQRELEKKGLVDPFVIEDDAAGEIFIGGHSKKNIETHLALLVEKKPAVVNWEEQWAQFAENFKDGKAHIQVGEKTLLLTPGAGFGDLSHPTTALMLEMMKAHVTGESVIDIGTGSGILALASLLMGAKSALGIDIDPKAIQHAKENAKLNQLKATFRKTLPQKIGKKHILLMNMILPEQIAFDPQRLNPLAKQWIVSGILKSQKKGYLAQAKAWGWKPISEVTHSEWLGFVFIQQPHT